MIKEIKLTTVYIPVNDKYSEEYTEQILCDNQGAYIENLEKQESVVFTQEQYNEHIKSVIENTLKLAADNAQTNCDEGGELGTVNEQSIIEILPTIMKKYKL